MSIKRLNDRARKIALHPWAGTFLMAGYLFSLGLLAIGLAFRGP